MIRIIKFNDKYKDAALNHIKNIYFKEFGYVLNENRFPDIYHISQRYQVNNGNFWIALEDDNVAGTVGVLDFGEGQCHLKRMMVVEKLRGTGLANRLLDTAINHCKEKGFKTIYLTTSEKMERAMKFYEKNKFERVDSLPKDLPTYNDNIFYMLKLL